MKVKSSLSGPDGGQRNGRDYEQHRGQEARGGEGRIVLCNSCGSMASLLSL